MLKINLSRPLKEPDKDTFGLSDPSRFANWPAGTFKLEWGHLTIYGSDPVTFYRTFPKPASYWTGVLSNLSGQPAEYTRLSQCNGIYPHPTTED